MKYTAAERASICAALKSAVGNLWNGNSEERRGEEFICFAMVSSLPGYKAACHMIEERLGGQSYANVESWLIDNGYVPKEDTKDWMPEVQAFRKRWLDALIEEFSE